MERLATSILGLKVFSPSLPKLAPNIEQAELQRKITLRTELEQEILQLGSKVVEGALLSSWQEPVAKEGVGQQKQQKKLTAMSGKMVCLRGDIEQLCLLASDTGDAPVEDQAAELDGKTSR